MEGWEDPEDAAAARACQKCGEPVAAEELQRCPWCLQYFCSDCRSSKGASDYCSGACAEAMFHGGEGEEDAEGD